MLHAAGMPPPPSAVLEVLLERHGVTYAAAAGIVIPAGQTPPAGMSFRLLCLSLLLSARIRSDIAVRAAKALVEHGWGTPEGLAASNRAERTQVLNRAGYARYDEKTSRMLGAAAQLTMRRYQADLEGLRARADHRPARELTLLQEYPGIGPVGAAIFAREVQAAWTEFYPFADSRTMATAAELGLPDHPSGLAELAGGPARFPRTVAALVRCRLAHDEARTLGLAAAPPPPDDR